MIITPSIPSSLGVEPLLLAHSGSHNHQGATRHPQSPAKTSPVAEPDKGKKTQASEPETPTLPATIEAAPSPVAKSPVYLANSLSGLPFALGELSLALIVAGPICLSALKRWLRS